MRRTFTERVARDRVGPRATWEPDHVPGQRPDDPWRAVEDLSSTRAVTPTRALDPLVRNTLAPGQAAYTSPDGSQWSWDGAQWQPLLALAEPVRARRWRSRAILVGGVALLALLVAAGTLASPWGSVTRAERAAIRGVLQSAEFAQLVHRTENPGYAESVDELIRSGFTPSPLATVAVVSATDESFCISAGPIGAQPVAWLTQDGPSPIPCG